MNESTRKDSMITLYTFGPAFGLPDPSPFVVKAEMLLKLANVPYQTNRRGGMKKAPKGKLPFIEDDGQLIADSTFIRWHLEQKYRLDLDQHLSEAEKGVAWAVEKMLEDNFYWAVVDARWLVDANFEAGPSMFFKIVPWPARPLAQKVIRRKVAKSLHEHGMGRHSRAEIETIGGKDLEAVSRILGDKPYLMGDEPCGADATVFAFVGGILCKVFDTPLRTKAEQLPNLVAYAARMQGRFFPALQGPGA